MMSASAMARWALVLEVEVVPVGGGIDGPPPPLSEDDLTPEQPADSSAINDTKIEAGVIKRMKRQTAEPVPARPRAGGRSAPPRRPSNRRARQVCRVPVVQRPCPACRRRTH